MAPIKEPFWALDQSNTIVKVSWEKVCSIGDLQSNVKKVNVNSTPVTGHQVNKSIVAICN